MKILFVSEAYPPMSGGVATSAQRVAREMVKLGMQVIVVTFDNTKDVTVNDYCNHEIDQGVRVYRFGPFFLKNPFMKMSVEQLGEKYKAVLRRRAFGQIIRLIKDENIDIVLSFYLMNAGYMAQMVANHLSVPCVAGVRGNDIGRNIFHVQRFSVIRWVLEEADAIVCVNQHLKNRAEIAFKQVREKTRVIPNGFDYSRVAAVNGITKNELLKKFNWPIDSLILCFIGTLREKKGAALICEIMEEVAKRDIDVKLLVVGPELGGVERYMIGERWNQLKEKGIIGITGQISREIVLRYANSSDIVFVPSLDDGMANGLLEGMSMGLCPLVSGIFEDVIEDYVDGRIVPIGETFETVKVIEELYNDRDMAKKMGNKASEKIKKYHKPEDEAKAYIELFNELVED